jgi:diacylglycerol kinase (ATP)
VRVYAIVNPTSGGGRSVRLWRQARPILVEAGWQITERLSERRGHARELAAAADAPVVLSVGGDGTAHEVANGLLGAGRGATLAVLPVGAGNDFARAIGVPREPLAAAGALVSSRTREIDVGEVNGRCFLTIAGAGFDGEVARLVNAWPKLLGGMATYVLGILKMLVTYRPVQVRITIDGVPETERLFLIAVGNTAWNAGGMWLVPPARPDDGILHAVIAGPLTRLEALLVLPKVFSGGHLGHPKIRQAMAREITVEGAALAVQADGESVGTLPARFTVRPRALTVLAPPP